jgi:hypothetical protein
MSGVNYYQEFNMSRPYGSQKNKILSYIASHPKTSSATIGEVFGIDHKRAGTLLWNYERHGELVKERGPAQGKGSHHYVYSIPAIDIPKNKQELLERQTLVKAQVSPQSELSQPEAPMQAPAPQIQPTETDLGVVLNGVIETMAYALTRQIVNRLEPMLAEKLELLVAKAVGDSLPETKPTAEAPATLSTFAAQRRKICVVGLLPNQAHIIEREFKDCFDLRFIRTDESIHQLRNTARNADLTILMAGFINHAMTDALKKEHLERIEFVYGGMSTLRDKLTNHYLATAQ